MAKLRKRPKGDPKSPRSAQSPVDRTGAPRPPPLPVIYEQSAFEAQRLRHAPSHERHRSEPLGRAVVPERATAEASPSEGTKSTPPAAQLLTSEPRAGPRAPRRPSPLRMSQDASAASEMAVAGPSTPGLGNRRGKCGPSCQKCGRPRKPVVAGASTGESTPAPPASWPLPGPGNETLPGAGEPAHNQASGPEAPPPEPTAVPGHEERSKRRKYFSLPTKQKPSFKGPTELASGKGKTVELPSNTAPSQERPRPASAPAPKSAFKGPAEGGAPGPPPPRATAHVHFATDEHLGRFAGVIRAPETTSSARIQALRALTPGPAAAPVRPPPMDHAVGQTSPAGPQQAPPRHPPALVATQPAPRANSAILYEWPLVTTLVNQPHSNPSTRPAAPRNAPGRSSLSVSKRPSRRTLRPYTSPPIHSPLPTRRTSSRHKTLLQQSRKVSYIMDQAANNSRDSMSIQILDMLQGFPGGELAATAKTEPDAQLLSERPSQLRLQTYPPNMATESLTRDRGAPRDKASAGLYSPSDYSSGDDDDDDDDDDDQAMPATPLQSEFSLTSYSIGDDKKLNRRPASTVTQTSYSIGDDRHLPLKKPSNRDLAPAPPSAPSSASDDSELASAESPPSAPSTSLPPAHPLTLTPSPDSEGLIPVNRRLSIVDLPEVISTGSEEDIDPDWFSWGALPGSYGSAGMWSGGPSPGLEPVGPMELGVAS